MNICIHQLDEPTCSTCNETPDSTLDDTIAPGLVISWATPSVERQAKAEPQYSRRYKWSSSNGTSGVTVVPSWTTDSVPIPVTHDPKHVEPWRKRFDQYIESVEVLDADDPQEIRVREAVRDFGLLTRHRDLKYAVGIGLDYDAYVWGIVAPETDHLAVEGAGLPVRQLSTRPTRPHDRKLESVRAWRASRGCA